MLTCSVTGCTNKFRAKGLCSTHYNRKRKHGNEFTVLVRRKPKKLEYLLSHMWDDCPKWPFGRSTSGYGVLGAHKSIYLAHRLVCEIAHGPAPDGKPFAAHICGKGNEGCFGARCLAWKSPRENSADMAIHGTRQLGEKNHRAILTEAQALQIIAQTGLDKRSALATQFGVSRRTIQDVQQGRSWKHLQHQFMKESAL